jgi:predicted ATPase/DNA-binding CsgD family transcriptional regulator
MDSFDNPPLSEALKEREIDILRLMAEGLSNREIAQELYISLETVKWYNKQMYAKLDVGSRTQAIARARELGLLGGQAAPPVSSTPLKHNLPAQITSFVGREREIAEVGQLLADARLLTLTGPGGTGKTRLSLEVAAQAADGFKDGALVVYLAAIRDPALVTREIAKTLGVTEVAGQSLTEGLKTTLRSKELLLVVDNFEHLLDAAPLVSTLLAAAPGLKVLVTSREVLRLYGEQEYKVEPLSLPDPGRLETASALLRYEAVDLFTQRAAAAEPGFAFSEENAPTIAEICVRLDGLPLAIELAAARMRLFPPEMLLERLDDRLKTLTGGARDLPRRLQTMREAIAWSYDLLDEDEQTLFARLAVFQGGQTLDVVEAVCMEGLAFDVVEGVESLLTKSLLSQDLSAEGEPRFVMLETIHEYAWDRLGHSGEAESIQRRHAAYFTGWVERAEEDLYGGARQVEWLGRLEADHDNLRCALAWALDRGDRDLGQRLAGAMTWFWYRQDHHREWRAWTERASVGLESASLPVRAKLTWCGAMCLMLRQEIPQAIDLFREAIGLFQALGDELRAGYALIYMSNLLAVDPQRHEEAMAELEGAMAIMRELGNMAGFAQAVNVRGNIEHAAGHYGQAQGTYEQLLELAVEIGDRLREALAYANLGRTAVKLGELDKARQLNTQSLSLAQEIDSKYLIMANLHMFAHIAEGKGAYRRAARLLGACVAAQEEFGTLEQAHMQAYFDELVAALRERIGGETFEAAWAEGYAMAVDEALGYALSEDAE